MCYTVFISIDFETEGKPMDYSAISNLPKIDLHCHIDGSLSPFFVKETLHLKDHPDVVAQCLRAPEDCQSLTEYLKCFDLPIKCLQTADAITDGILNIVLLDSVISGINQTFDNQELYPTKEDKAAYLAFGIIKNHPFNDGNKRTGIGLMLTFLVTNGIKLKVTNEELIDLGVGIADSRYSQIYIKEWIIKHEYF